MALLSPLAGSMPTPASQPPPRVDAFAATRHDTLVCVGDSRMPLVLAARGLFEVMIDAGHHLPVVLHHASFVQGFHREGDSSVPSKPCTVSPTLATSFDGCPPSKSSRISSSDQPETQPLLDCALLCAGPSGRASPGASSVARLPPGAGASTAPAEARSTAALMGGRTS